MSIKVKNVTKLYGSQKALDNVSFEISPGEVVGFLGPNGAGKTTMMKIIACFIPQTSGDVSVCSHDVVENSIAVRKNVGYLPENNPLYPDMYVNEFLGFIARLHRMQNIRARVDEMVEMTGLETERKKKIGALSKGYRQRVGLAQALLHDPAVLVLDEPTSGLDPIQLTEIRSLIMKMGKEKTVMLSTHIMQEVEAICGRAIIIHKGKIVADDTVGELRRKTGRGQRITVEFNAPASAELLERIGEVTAVCNIRGNIWQIEAKQGMDIRQEIFQFAVHANLSVLAMHKEEQSIEDIFKNLTMK